MADQIFQITFKPGILRDGSPFQGEYCTKGQWVRFFRGMPQNMGGMNCFEFKKQDETIIDLKQNVINALYVDNTDGTKIVLGAYNKIDSTGCNLTLFTGNSQQYDITSIDTMTPTIIDRKVYYQFIPIIFQTGDNFMSSILCIGRTINNITNNTPAAIVQNLTLHNHTFTNVPLQNDILAAMTGGALFINPYLFIYGANGLVRWSKSKYTHSSPTNPFKFDLAKYSINISADKVIYGAAIRGGAASPSALFWTLSSVVRLTNVGKLKGPVEDPDDIDFKKEVITNDSSILSSNCVVEYDGIFYWPGTGRFFTYNGVVVPLENNLNRQTFFDTVDMNKRQLVFGVKNVVKDEIWWFYPEKGKDENIGCTRAVIFNIMDNSWYDTAIERDCGYFDNVSGNMYTVGKQLSDTDDDLNNYIWQHEVGQNQVNHNKDPSTVPIKSSFTTPIISYATFNNFKQPAGIDKWMQIKRIEPNFVLTENAQLTIIINSQEYPSSVVVPSNDFFIDNNTKRIEGMFQGRNISFTISSNRLGSGYQMGINFVMADIGDGR